MARAHLRAILLGLTLALCGVGVSACGSSSSSSSSPRASSSSSSSSESSTSSSTTASPAEARVGALTRALLHARTKPAVSAAVCLTESAAERARSPFGPTGPPVFACSITAGGSRTAYDVQLLPTGCFVAERRKPGKAIYGCGAGNA